MNKFYKNVGVVLFLSLGIVSSHAFLFKECPHLSSAALCRLARDSSPAAKTRVLPKDKPFLKKVCSMEEQYFKGEPVGNKCECSYDIASTRWFAQLEIGNHEAENTPFTIISTTQTKDLECPVLSFSEVRDLAFGLSTSLDIGDRGLWQVKRGTWKHKHWASVKGSKKPSGSPKFVKAHRARRYNFCTYRVPTGTSGSWRPITVLEMTKSLGVPASSSRDQNIQKLESRDD
jgi:hypothetical protein